jgi:histidinol-phosphate aminotransferase
MLPVRPGIMEIAPYVGGDATVPGLSRVIRLASNENPLGASPAAMAVYRELAGELHRYPDGSAAALRAAIAQAEGLDAERIVCGAGSDELISLLVRAYAGPGDEVLHSAHGFLMYPIAARSVGATPVAAPEVELTADVDALLERVSPRTRLVFLANPNNPTGSYLPASAVQRLHQGLPADVLLVIDAAYAEYADVKDYDNGASLAARHDNVVMTRTFSKIHGLSALRLGWAYCPPAVAEVLNRIRGPFNVSQAALAAGCAALADQAHVARSLAHNAAQRDRLAADLTALGLDPRPSLGNFLLVRFPDGAAAAGRTHEALQGRGILVRAMGAYGLPDCLRITIGTEDEVRACVAALKEILS